MMQKCIANGAGCPIDAALSVKVNLFDLYFLQANSECFFKCPCFRRFLFQNCPTFPDVP